MKLPKELEEKLSNLSENSILCNRTDHFMFKMAFYECYRLMQEREVKLVEVLKFYADKINWNDGLHSKVFDIISISDLSKNDDISLNSVNGGRRARETLKELGIE